MIKKIFYNFVFILIAFASINAQTVEKMSETVMILPFENTSNKPEFNWVGESFAGSLSELLKVPTLNVVSNQERKIIQQRLNIPLTDQTQKVDNLRRFDSELIFNPRFVAPFDGRHSDFSFDVLRVLPHTNDLRVAD
jgi:hypothetical protein